MYVLICAYSYAYVCGACTYLRNRFLWTGTSKVPTDMAGFRRYSTDLVHASWQSWMSWAYDTFVENPKSIYS